LAIEEQRNVIEILHSERFQDKAPYEIYATLLDEGRYLCSIRTMYGFLPPVTAASRTQKNRFTLPL
jgi:hypothetical protein